MYHWLLSILVLFCSVTAALAQPLLPRRDYIGFPTRQSYPDLIANLTHYCTSTSAANTYTCTVDNGQDLTYALVAGQEVVLTVTTTNTGASTLNPSGLGAIPLKVFVGTALFDVAAGDLPAGKQITLRYDGSVFQLLNPETVLTACVAERARGLYNVKCPPYLAKGDGVTSDTAAIEAAEAAITTGGVLYFPPGVYVITQLNISSSNVIWRGAGMYASILRSTATNAMIFSTIPHVNIAFEDIGFDGNNVNVSTYTDDQNYRGGSLRIERCRFFGFLTVDLQIRGSNFIIDSNVFEASGAYSVPLVAARAVDILQGAKHGRISNNRMRYVTQGIQGITDASASQVINVTDDVTINDNFFDLGFYTKIQRSANSGGTVTYTATVLTDTAAAFTGIVANDFVRVMPTRNTGTGTISQTKVTDAAATFITSGVLRGEFVRVGGKFGIISNVTSETILGVEEWLSETDRTVVDAPTTGTYTVYGVYLGKVVSSTATTVTVIRWMDLNGVTLTPSAGTLYEILPPPGIYPFLCGYACRGWQVTGNTLLRGYADQISYFGYEGVIANNVMGYGQDVGITLAGQYTTVMGNRISHQGTVGIYLLATNDSVIANNSITDTTWTNAADTTSLAGIHISNGARNLIANNTVGIETTMPLARHGIALAGTATDNTLQGNHTRNHTVGGIRLHGSGVVKTHYIANRSFGETPISYNAAFFTSGVNLPLAAAQTIAAGNTITADMCGGLKQITASGAVTTSTTDTFTAPSAANESCTMRVCNIGTVNTITLDKNVLFFTSGGIDLPLPADSCVQVVSDGTKWRQVTAVQAAN